MTDRDRGPLGGAGRRDNYKRIESTRAARVLQERRLDAEEKKFAAGMSRTSWSPRPNATCGRRKSRSCCAVADYRNSVNNFERVQAGRAPARGGGLTVDIGGGATRVVN